MLMFMPFMPAPNPPFINMFCMAIGSIPMPGIPDNTLA
jgi:hypothetical protein